MKLLSKVTLINLFYLTTLPAMADDSMNQYTSQQTASNTQNIAQYLLNLGKYIGYDITKYPPTNNQNLTVSSTLLNEPALQAVQTYVFNTLLGSIPVNAFNSALMQFVPSQVPNASALNAWANYTFNAQGYGNAASQQQGKVSVSALIDQQNFQADPVSQSVLNILGTPDYSYCMNYDGTAWTQNCPLLYENLVSSNVIGTLPGTYQFYTYSYNQQFLSQLNSNSLLAPLLYSTDSTSSNSSSQSSNSTDQGLTAQNQAQQAANFIRYASGTVTPIKLPKLKDYDKLYAQAITTSGSGVSPIDQANAQSVLSNYFTSLRTYAAQSSVGLSNLYFIMSKRLPQSQDTSGSSQSSQAMSEFKMATWRLFNPDMSANNQWLNQINNASPATVEKEIAALLAEMNYQMYLDRQIQERILLTNSIMLMQNTRATQPNADFSAGTPAQSQ